MTFTISTPPGERLIALLRGAHDDGASDLDVHVDVPALVVLRADGSEISETEEIEVRALLAAHAAEPFR